MMKSSSIQNHERHLKAENKKEAKIALDIVRSKVYEKIGPMTDAQIEKAIADKDTKAFEVLTDRAFGKAKESLSINEVFSLLTLAQKWEEQKNSTPITDVEFEIIPPEELPPPSPTP